MWKIRNRKSSYFLRIGTFQRQIFTFVFEISWAENSRKFLGWHLMMMMMMMMMMMLVVMKCSYKTNSWPTKSVKPLSVNPTKWSNTLTNCLSMFDHFVGFLLKGLNLTSSQDHCQRFSSPQTSDTTRAIFEFGQSLYCMKL